MGPWTKEKTTVGIAILLSLPLWLLLFIYEGGAASSGDPHYLRYCAELVGVFGVAYLVSLTLVVVWKWLLLAGVLLAAYWRFGPSSTPSPEPKPVIKTKAAPAGRH